MVIDSLNRRRSIWHRLDLEALVSEDCIYKFTNGEIVFDYDHRITFCSRGIILPIVSLW